MAAAAAQAVWGDKYGSTEEPISGLKGDVSKGEPFDAGNIGSKHLICHMPLTPCRYGSGATQRRAQTYVSPGI